MAHSPFGDCDCSYCKTERMDIDSWNGDSFWDQPLSPQQKIKNETIRGMEVYDFSNAQMVSCPSCYEKGFRWGKDKKGSHVRIECPRCFGLRFVLGMKPK